MEGMLVVIIDTIFALVIYFSSEYFIKKTAKYFDQEKERKLALSKVKSIFYGLVALFTIVTSYSFKTSNEININGIFLNFVIVTISIFELISNKRDAKNLEKELYGEINIKVKGITNKYNKILVNMINNKKHEEYLEIKKDIKKKCIENKSYEDKEYILLEIERIDAIIENKKSPYQSYFYTIISFVFSMIISILISMAINIKYNLLILLGIVFIYSIIIFFSFLKLIKNNKRDFEFYLYYKKILEELKQNIN
ncbi:hypothetical protein FDB39_04065 [Clostridium botulinum]|nr:hypothetical protein [Clostridium botulinum]